MTKTESLRALVREMSHNDFTWGSFDCCQFVALHLQNIRGGENYARRFAYCSEEGAEEILEREGGIEGIASEAFGGPPVAHQDLVVGDVVQVDLGPPGIALGIMSANGAIVLHRKGMLTAPPHRIVNGWSL